MRDTLTLVSASTIFECFGLQVENFWRRRELRGWGHRSTAASSLPASRKSPRSRTLGVSPPHLRQWWAWVMGLFYEHYNTCVDLRSMHYAPKDVRKVWFMRMFMFVFHDGIDFTRSTTPKYFDLFIWRSSEPGCTFWFFTPLCTFFPTFPICAWDLLFFFALKRPAGPDQPTSRDLYIFVLPQVWLGQNIVHWTIELAETDQDFQGTIRIGEWVFHVPQTHPTWGTEVLLPILLACYSKHSCTLPQTWKILALTISRCDHLNVGWCFCAFCCAEGLEKRTSWNYISRLGHCEASGVYEFWMSLPFASPKKKVPIAFLLRRFF